MPAAKSDSQSTFALKVLEKMSLTVITIYIQQFNAQTASKKTETFFEKGYRTQQQNLHCSMSQCGRQKIKSLNFRVAHRQREAIGWTVSPTNSGGIGTKLMEQRLVATVRWAYIMLKWEISDD